MYYWYSLVTYIHIIKVIWNLAINYPGFCEYGTRLKYPDETIIVGYMCNQPTTTLQITPKLSQGKTLDYFETKKFLIIIRTLTYPATDKFIDYVHPYTLEESEKFVCKWSNREEDNLNAERLGCTKKIFEYEHWCDTTNPFCL